MNRAWRHRFSRPERQVLAVPADRCEPADSDAIADTDAVHSRSGLLDTANDLVAGDDWNASPRQLAVDDVQVGPADAAREDTDQHLICSRLRHRHFDGLDISAARADKGHGAHQTHPLKCRSSRTHCKDVPLQHISAVTYDTPSQGRLISILASDKPPDHKKFVEYVGPDEKPVPGMVTGAWTALHAEDRPFAQVAFERRTRSPISVPRRWAST